jgi:microsomal epoxide hydrolase
MIRLKKLPDPSTLDSEDKAALQRALSFINSGRAYSMEHGTRPSTIGLVLAASPLALLAWYDLHEIYLIGLYRIVH